MLSDILKGVVIGAAGGGTAGLLLWIVKRLNEYEIEWRECRRIYQWLNKVTEPTHAKKWRSTRAVASYNNLAEDRVRYLCSHHKKILLSTREKEMWGIAGRARDDDNIGVV